MSNRLLRFAISGVEGLNPMVAVISVLLVIISLWGNTNPVPDLGKFQLFIAFFGVWLALISGVVVFQLLLDSHHVIPSISRMHLFLCALMFLRLWGNWAHFPEFWMLSAVVVVTLIRQHYFYRQWTKDESDEPQKLQQMMAKPAEAAEPLAETHLCEIRMPEIRFSDVIGMAAMKERLLMAGQDIVTSHQRGDKARNGILLFGKPGNGKTYMAEALAGELKLPFLTLTVGSVVSKWIGDSPSRIPAVFAEARAHAPCVLFFDEVDSLLTDRDAMNSSEDSGKTVNILLTELVNIRRSGVIVVAATNHLDRLDSAAIREGRFDFKIEVPVPDADARRHLIKSQAKGRLEQSAIETATQRWEGFSVSRISAVVEEARKASRQRQLISYDDLGLALRRIQGRQGQLAENTPTLDGLTLMPDAREKLNSLAYRMQRVVEIESRGGTIPRGVLFYGPPGTGKTLSARTLAKTARWAFLSVSGTDLLANTNRIDELIEEASDLRPCVIFIDEADDVLANRRHSSYAAITNKLLAAIDGSSGQIPDVLFIAATNHPDAMDAAALRGGRFTEKVQFDVPDLGTLRTYIERWEAAARVELAEGVTPISIALSLEGHSIANVKEILQMAINRAIARHDADDQLTRIKTADIVHATADMELVA
ncbi:ATP-binding protein [Dechloromonas sp. HYN0024]|uniref:ATP-binding protein n=1 Tax=Dechloromonas sp. HYN0024 TaxID=2231055 RepID=UPI000E432997|nr:ATP-binding protein [Dechloromonas sp. HYN0024]AXS80161.1 AAA family ATPase [Dechloromonas sp. HYN0024]